MLCVCVCKCYNINISMLYALCSFFIFSPIITSFYHSSFPPSLYYY